LVNLVTRSRSWIDPVVRAKLTFRHGDNSPVGLVKNKKVYIIIASVALN
tara:strand:+ start:164 stop:310 length:147 start_codon:yes stop_codon:yes gene_type:complete